MGVMTHPANDSIASTIGSMDIANSSDVQSLYSAPSKFEMTTFPNASLMNVTKTNKTKPKISAPNAKQRSFKNIPQQMIPEDEDDDDPPTPSAIIKPLNDYQNPSLRDLILRWIATGLGIISSIAIYWNVYQRNSKF